MTMDADKADLDERLVAKTQLKQQGICRLTVALSYNMILTFVTNGLVAIACPTDLAIFAPDNAALLNGLLMGFGALINSTGPVVGHLMDRFGRRRLMFIGAVLLCIGIGTLLLGVYTRSIHHFGLWVYSLGYILTNIGTLIMTTGFNAIVGELSLKTPERSGTISSIFGLYGLVGATLSFVAAGLVFPVSKTGHNIYWFTLILAGASNAAFILTIPSDEKPDATVTRNTNMRNRCFEVLAEWYSSEKYKPWRYVVVSRMLYYFAGGVFNGSILYFLHDCTDSADPASSMAIIAVFSIGGSFLAAWPAGKLSDAFGPFSCVLISGIAMSFFLASTPFLSSITIITCIVPIYGMAQVFRFAPAFPSCVQASPLPSP